MDQLPTVSWHFHQTSWTNTISINLQPVHHDWEEKDPIQVRHKHSCIFTCCVYSLGTHQYKCTDTVPSDTVCQNQVKLSRGTTTASYNLIKHSKHKTQYEQIRSFASSYLHNFLLKPLSSLLDLVLPLNSHSRVIGIIYSLINSHNTLTVLKKHWEEDLDTELSETLWKNIIQKMYSSSLCMRHIIIQLKIVHRLHWSKNKLARFKPNITPECDRCRQTSATLSRMFWYCPKLKGVWESLFATLSEILHTPRKSSSVPAIFTIYP